MAETKIEWTRGPNGEQGYTFNPWMGCQKVSPACDHCYAEVNTAVRALGVQWGPHAQRRRTSDANWKLPKRWNAEAARLGIRYRVFCASLADVFDNEVPPAWRVDLLRLIEETPHLDWLLLTKRIGNVERLLDEAASLMPEVMVWPLPNVWIGATIVNRMEMLRDAAKLRAVPSRVRFWSVEPMLGDLGEIPRDLLPDWVICGGESGHHARPMHPQWVRSILEQCQAAGVPFFLKQWGEWASAQAAGLDLNACYDRSRAGGWLEFDGTLSTGPDAAPKDNRAEHVFRLGKENTASMLDGHNWKEVPA